MENKKELLKYMIFAGVMGIVVGGIDTVFGKGLILIGEIRNKYFWYLIPFLPIAGIVITWLYYHFNELSLKGMTLVFETGQQKRKGIPLALIPLVMIGTWLTHLFGGSAGREGVAVQIGATLSHYFTKYFHFPKNGKVLLITGMAAGFAGLFQTPLTALFFAMEVMVIGKIEYEALLPGVIASFTASYTSHFLGLEKFSVNIQQSINMNDLKNMMLMILVGIILGIVGRIFSTSLIALKTFFKNKIENPYKRIGYISILLGFILAPIFHLPIELCVALGYTGVFASATNTLLAPMMIGLEVFGGHQMIAFLIICIFAYLVNGNKSIYTAQIKNF